MQALILPSRPAPAITAASLPSQPRLLLQVFRHTASLSPHYLSRLIPPRHSPLSISPKPSFSCSSLYATPLSTGPAGYPTDDEQSEASKLAQVSKRLENTSRYFKRWGSFGFWGQLLCTLVSAVIISFSTVLTGKVTSPVTFYTTAGGIAAAFVSVFWSFGYIRLSERLRRTANDPAKAPPRADVVKSLRNGIFLNIIGMGASLLGMQATVGLLVAKALTSSAAPYYQGIAPGQSPVLGLDVFLVQASANTILSHFFGLVSSLELLRSVTLPNLQAVPIRS